VTQKLEQKSKTQPRQASGIVP